MAGTMDKAELDTVGSDSEVAGSKDPCSIAPQVHFRLWQTLGMNFSITCAPLCIGAYLALIIGLGGSAFYIWGFLVAAIFQLITCVALAEIASAMPHSSGPAFWVQHLAPVSASQFLSYLIGWTTTGAWWFVVGANCLYMSQFTLGLAQALNPGYTPNTWETFLVHIAWTFSLFLLNLPRAFKLVPRCLASGILIINATTIFIFISLLVRATPKPSAHQVFVEIVDESGWSSKEVLFFIALSPGIVTVGSFDATTHITDEVENPSKQVPQVMIGSAILSAIAGFIMTIVYSFSNVKPANLLHPFADQPLLQLLFDATSSRALATIATICVIICFWIASLGCFTSWNRLYWSVACQGILPFPRTMSKLSSRDKIPLNALVVNLVLSIVLGAVQLGSLTALNAVIGGVILCMTATYSLTFALALWRGHDFLSKDRWLNLGRLGTILQIIGLLWCVFVSVWLSFPLYLPVTVPSMNWASVVFVGVLVCSLFHWLAFRRFINPVHPT